MSMTLDEAIEHAEDIAISAIGCECREEHRQLAEWLRELQERRKEPEIIYCHECIHYKPMSSNWGNCYVHGNPPELHRACLSCDYCSWAKRSADD